jgi:hypothetical protein
MVKQAQSIKCHSHTHYDRELVKIACKMSKRKTLFNAKFSNKIFLFIYAQSPKVVWSSVTVYCNQIQMGCRMTMLVTLLQKIANVNADLAF